MGDPIIALGTCVAKIISQDNVEAMKKWRSDIRRWVKEYPNGNIIAQIKDFPASPKITDLYALLFAMAYSKEFEEHAYSVPPPRVEMYENNKYEGNQYSISVNLLMGLIQQTREQVTKDFSVADCTLFFYPRRLLTGFRNALRYFMQEGQMVYNDFYGMIAFGWNFEAGRPGTIYTDFPQKFPTVYFDKSLAMGGIELTHWRYGEAKLIPPGGSKAAEELFWNEFCVVAVLRKAPPKKKAVSAEAYYSLNIAIFAAEKSLEEYAKTQQKVLPTDAAVFEIFRQVIADPLERLEPQEDDWDVPEVSEESTQRKALAQKLQARTLPEIVVTPPPRADLVVFSPPAENIYQSLPAEAMLQGIVLPPPPPSGPIQLPLPPPSGPVELPPAPPVPEPARPYQALPAEAARPSPTPLYGPLPQDEAGGYGVLPEAKHYQGFPAEEEMVLAVPYPSTLEGMRAFRKPWPGRITVIDQDILHTAKLITGTGVRGVPSKQTFSDVQKIINKTGDWANHRLEEMPEMARNSDTIAEVFADMLFDVGDPWTHEETCAAQAAWFKRDIPGEFIFKRKIRSNQPTALADLCSLGMLILGENTQPEYETMYHRDDVVPVGREYVVCSMDAMVALTFVEYLPATINFRIYFGDGEIDERTAEDAGVMTTQEEILIFDVYREMETQEWQSVANATAKPRDFKTSATYVTCIFWTQYFRDPNLIAELINALARTYAQDMPKFRAARTPTQDEVMMFSAPPSVAPAVAFSAPSAAKVVYAKPGIAIVSTPDDEMVSREDEIQARQKEIDRLLAKKAALLEAGKTIAAEAVVIPASAESAAATPAPKPANEKKKVIYAAPKRTRKTEKQRAQAKANAWWEEHPQGKTRDRNVTAKKVVTKASDYVPSKNDFRGVDTKTRKSK